MADRAKKHKKKLTTKQIRFRLAQHKQRYEKSKAYYQDRCPHAVAVACPALAVRRCTVCDKHLPWINEVADEY